MKEEKADAEEGGGDGDDGGRQGMYIFIGASATRFPQTTRPYGASIQKGTHQQSGIPQKVTFLEEQSKDPDAMKPEDGGLTNPPEEQFEHPPNGGLPAWSAHEHPYQNGFVPGKHNSDIHMNAHSVFVPLSSHPPAAVPGR